MSQPQGSRYQAPSFVGWLPQLSFIQWVAVFTLATVIAVLPGIWTLPGLVALIVSLLVLIKPEGGVYLLTMSIPLGYLLEVEGDEFSVTPTEMIIGLMVVGWALRAFSRRRIVIPPTPLLIPLLGMLAIVALSINYAASPALTMKETLKWAELLLVYLFIVSEMASLRHVLTLLVLLLLGAIIEALIGSVQFVFSMGPEFYSIGRFMRAYGTFEQPNPYAGYLGMLIPLAVGILLAWPGKRLRNYTLFALALAVAAVGMSLSRGAWVGISLALVIMMVFWSHRTRILLAAGILAATPLSALAFLNILPPELTARLATVFDYFRFVDVTREVVTPQNFAVIERMAHWQAAINMIEAHPLLGVGAGNYPAVYEAYSVEGWDEALGHAHNFYLNIAAETGFVGLATYLSIFVIALLHSVKWLLRSFSEGQPDQAGRAADPYAETLLWRGILVGVLGALIASCIHNMFDNLFVHSMSIQLGMILALGQLSAIALARPAIRSQENP
ncbi:MAG: O-antigen ligase family protein [Chloroflexota bacterium]|jgi:putative inorganic carbon (HCO3(-)) transporter